MSREALALSYVCRILNLGTLGDGKRGAMANQLAGNEQLSYVRTSFSSPLPCCSLLLTCTCKGLDACDRNIGTSLLMGK